MVERFEKCVKGLFDVEPALPANIEQVAGLVLPD